MTEDTPRTTAGRALALLLAEADIRWPDDFTRFGRDALTPHILKIEAEASAVPGALSDHPFKDEWRFQRSMSKGNPVAGQPIAPDQPCFDCGVPLAAHGAEPTLSEYVPQRDEAGYLDAERARVAAVPGALSDEDIAQRFHEAYERLAPSFGYRTRDETAGAWEDVPGANRRLMTAVAGEVRRGLGVPGALREALHEAVNDVPWSTRTLPLYRDDILRAIDLVLAALFPRGGYQ